MTYSCPFLPQNDLNLIKCLFVTQKPTNYSCFSPRIQKNFKTFLYYIAHQHFLELLETGDKLGGLKVLRKNITSLGIVSPGKIRELSTYLNQGENMFSEIDENS